MKLVASYGVYRLYGIGLNEDEKYKLNYSKNTFCVRLLYMWFS